MDCPQIAWAYDFKQLISHIFKKKILLHMIFLERIFGNTQIEN
jgi:hypothetical protein